MAWSIFGAAPMCLPFLPLSFPFLPTWLDEPLGDCGLRMRGTGGSSRWARRAWWARTAAREARQVPRRFDAGASLPVSCYGVGSCAASRRRANHWFGEGALSFGNETHVAMVHHGNMVASS